MEHPEELLLKQIDPVKKAQFFGAIFKKFPTYEDLKPGTQKTPLFTGVNPIFSLLTDENFPLVTSRNQSCGLAICTRPRSKLLWASLMNELRLPEFAKANSNRSVVLREQIKKTILWMICFIW